jgi:CRISPR type I-E-associated protein CasB/Cse2
MTTTAPADREARFVSYLRELRDDRYRGGRAMANLRTGLGKPAWEAPAMHEWVGPWFGLQSSRWGEECYFGVAALFSLHPLDWPQSESGAEEGTPPAAGRSLGDSIVELARRRPEMTVQKRLRVLVGADRDTLFDHLQSVVRLLRRDEVPIDWTQLLRDALTWGPRPARQWAEDFYRREEDA